MAKTSERWKEARRPMADKYSQNIGKRKQKIAIKSVQKDQFKRACRFQKLESVQRSDQKASLLMSSDWNVKRH